MTPRPRTSLQLALEQLRSHERDLRELRVTARTMRVQPDALVLEDGTRLELVRDGIRRFCAYAGAPAAYVLGLGQAVRARLLAHEVERGALGEAITLVARGSELVGFVDPALLTLRASDVFQAATEALPEDAGAYVHRLHADDDSVQVEILGDATTEEMAAGDLVAGGVRLRHSPLGRSATQVEAYLLRLVCSNGLTHRDCVKTTHVQPPRTRRLRADHDGARELQLEQVRRIVRESWGRLRAKLAVLRETQREQIDVQRLLESWVRRGGLSERVHMSRLRRAWQFDGGGNTAYAAINALTRVATHDPEVTPHQRRILSGLAGILAFRREHICPRCFAALREPLSETVPFGTARSATSTMLTPRPSAEGAEAAVSGAAPVVSTGGLIELRASGKEPIKLTDRKTQRQTWPSRHPRLEHALARLREVAAHDASVPNDGPGPVQVKDSQERKTLTSWPIARDVDTALTAGGLQPARPQIPERGRNEQVLVEFQGPATEMREP